MTDHLHRPVRPAGSRRQRRHQRQQRVYAEALPRELPILLQGTSSSCSSPTATPSSSTSVYSFLPIVVGRIGDIAQVFLMIQIWFALLVAYVFGFRYLPAEFQVLSLFLVVSLSLSLSL